MNKIDQILAYVKSITERLNAWAANAKKVEELPEMEVMNAEALMMVSELEEGVWVSKKLEIQSIIDGISLAGQNNTVREVLLGEITDEHDLNYLFDNNAISVAATEIVILTVLQTVSAIQMQRQFLWKLGKGDFAPIGSSDLNTKVLELQPKNISEIIADELTAAPDAIVYDFGTITDPIIDVVNVAIPSFDFSDDEKIYYLRFTKDGIKYLYNFIGVNGAYGDSDSQMVESDLVLVYSSEIVDVISLIEGKLNHGGYPGTAMDLFINAEATYIKKLERQKVTISDNVASFTLTDERHFVEFTNASQGDFNYFIQGVGYVSGQNHPFRIRNNTGATFTLKHLVPSGSSYPGETMLFFPDGNDFELRDKEIIEFVYDTDNNRYGYFGLIRDQISDIENLTEELADRYTKSESNTADATTLATAQAYAANLITQIINGAPSDADTLKELNDKIIALQAIVGGTAPDGDSVVNTVTELLAVMATYPEGVDLATVLAGKVNITDIYNALDCIVAGKVLDARQGKVLNDAIATLTTAVAGKQASLISGTNIKTINGQSVLGSGDLTISSGVTRTLKTITSANLTTQDAAGFVAYINALGTVLVVAPNEIVEYQLSDTGRIFKLLLNGRSFGTGQAAITTANVEDVTLWMQKDLKLSNYPSTRNDGQLPTNRVLGTDASGNLKMYTIATAPAPYMEVLIPDSTLPSTTTNFTIKGAFFTPTMTVSIVGQTINYITFVNDNLIKVNVTTGAAEGLYAVTLNNGLSATFPNALSIILGTIYVPIASEWEAPTGLLDVSQDGKAKVITYESRGTNRWNKTLNISKKFYVRFQIAKTPTGYTANNEYNDDHIVLVKASDNTKAFSMYLNRQVGGNISMIYWCPTYGWGTTGNGYGSVAGVYSANSSANMDVMCAKTFDFRWINGVMYIYVDNVLTNTLVDIPSENMKLKISTKTFDIVNIKYIELP